MKRRNFGALTACSLAALKTGMISIAHAQAAPNAALLQTTLTPLGAERAGNADGSIPAWTGGYTTVPAGWQEGQFMPLPDAMANEQPVVVINAGNMAQYTGKITDGVAAMMTKYGFSIKVYPTHRTAAAPQQVYVNTANNVATARLSDPAQPRLGFTGAFGGVPFPIPDTSDPLIAGAQVIMNHLCGWRGYAWSCNVADYIVQGGSAVLVSSAKFIAKYPYYLATSQAQFDADGRIYTEKGFLTGPANLQGEQNISQSYTDFIKHQTQTWTLENGQGRVRKAPEVSFDTPSSYVDGMLDYDEYGLFSGSMEKYDWKLLGKKEMYIPYHCNGLIGAPVDQIFTPKFPNPEVFRWELHRVWVVDATLHQGERNTLARRRYYVDEDTWNICTIDEYDADNNLYHVNFAFPILRPDVPGTMLCGGGSLLSNNMQTNTYVSSAGVWNEKAHPTLRFYPDQPNTVFDPEAMAASAQY